MSFPLQIWIFETIMKLCYNRISLHSFVIRWVHSFAVMIPVLSFTCFRYFLLYIEKQNIFTTGESKSSSYQILIFPYLLLPYRSHLHCPSVTFQEFAGSLYVPSKQPFQKSVGFQQQLHKLALCCISCMRTDRTDSWLQKKKTKKKRKVNYTKNFTFQME